MLTSQFPWQPTRWPPFRVKNVLICNQDYNLLIKGIIIIPSVVCSEHMPIYNDRALFHLS